eukprot:Clim_evm6s17 gene=Clim_evmTU6s17
MATAGSIGSRVGKWFRTLPNRLANHTKKTVTGIYDDYTLALNGMRLYARDYPARALVMYGALGAAGYMTYTCPASRTFEAEVRDSHNKLILVGPPASQKSDSRKFVLRSLDLLDTNRVSYWRFGPFTLVMQNEFNKEECSNARVKENYLIENHWIWEKAYWQERMIDVGVLGHWRYLVEAMKDYDVAD